MCAQETEAFIYLSNFEGIFGLGAFSKRTEGKARTKKAAKMAGFNMGQQLGQPLTGPLACW